MAQNKTKIDRLHDQLNPFFNTRNNPVWNGLINAIGQSDQNVADLIVSVAQQYFVKTASRPYLDRLGANVLVNRPQYVGMDDITFRKYIPILSYQPKQVKGIVDALLNLFFNKQSTTAYVQSGLAEPFVLFDGAQLLYTVDGYKIDSVTFYKADFVDITAATAEEVTGVINRQSQDSFAITYSNDVTNQTFVQLFTNTVGSKGSMIVTGGAADIGLQFEGFIADAAQSPNVQWTVTKVGDLVTFQWTGGITPNLSAVQVGNTFISNIPGNFGNYNNIGSFIIESINLSTNSFSFRNLFGFPGVFTQTSANQSAFINNYRAVVWTGVNNRALTWEVTPGEFVVEMPASPPVVRRSLMGSAHINGTENLVTAVDPGLTQLTLNSVVNWPTTGGVFFLQQQDEINSWIATQSQVTTLIEQTNLIYPVQQYTYTSIVGNVLMGISPNLPLLAQTSHLSQSPPGMSSSGSLAFLDEAVSASITGITGPYIWDLSAAFVLSSLTGNLTQTINAGQSLKIISVGPNNLNPTGGQVIFDFGTAQQEGPVNYLFLPSMNIIAIDPSYVFKYNHAIGSAVTAIRNKGPIVMSGTGAEYAPYITDPSQAREILENLILEVSSVGIFVDFLIRYPVQLYSLLDVYDEDGNGAGMPFVELP